MSLHSSTTNKIIQFSCNYVVRHQCGTDRRWVPLFSTIRSKFEMISISSGTVSCVWKCRKKICWKLRFDGAMRKQITNSFHFQVKLLLELADVRARVSSFSVCFSFSLSLTQTHTLSTCVFLSIRIDLQTTCDSFYTHRVATTIQQVERTDSRTECLRFSESCLNSTIPPSSSWFCVVVFLSVCCSACLNGWCCELERKPRHQLNWIEFLSHSIRRGHSIQRSFQWSIS